MRFQTNKVIKQSWNNDGLSVTRAPARYGSGRQSRRSVSRQSMAAGNGGRACGFRLIKVLSGRRETHSRYLWNIECECRAGSKCAVVSAAPGGGLATLHLRDLSAVPGRSYGEWILHSKLHLPALLAIHSAALVRRVIFRNLLRLPRFTASAFAFLILTQCGGRPERYGEPSRFDTDPLATELASLGRLSGLGRQARK